MTVSTITTEEIALKKILIGLKALSLEAHKEVVVTALSTLVDFLIEENTEINFEKTLDALQKHLKIEVLCRMRLAQ